MLKEPALMDMEGACYKWAGIHNSSDGEGKLKVYLIHILDMQSQIGGVVRVRELARSLARRGLEVEIVCPASDKGAQSEPYQVKYLFAPRRSRAIRGLLYELFLFFYLISRREVWTRSCLIYVRRATLLLAPLLVSRLFGLTSVVEENGFGADFFVSDQDSKWVKMRSRILTTIQALSYRLASVIVTVSSGQMQYLKDEFGLAAHKVKLIPNGVDTDIFRPLDKGHCRQKLGLDTKAWYICFVGCFYAARGLRYLIQALPSLREHDSHVKVLLVGDGPERNNLESLAENLGVLDSVIFTGAVEYECVPSYTGASDVCIAPYDQTYANGVSLSPLKLYTYMACGRPVVLSDIPVEVDPLDKEQFALVFPPEDVSALSAAIIRLLDNPSLAEEMGQYARSVAEKHTWDHSAAKILDALTHQEDMHENRSCN